MTNSQKCVRMLRTFSRLLEPLKRSFHSSPLNQKKSDNLGLPECTKWMDRNKRVYTPEKPATPYVYFARTQIHYGPKKLLPIVWKIRGLSIDNAIAQMEFDNRKGAKEIKIALEEARKLAMAEHNFEFPSNMWVAEARANKGIYLKGLRRHARCRAGEIHYRYSHFLVKLCEGPPPKYYYVPDLTPQQKLEEFQRQLDNRYVTYSI